MWPNHSAAEIDAILDLIRHPRFAISEITSTMNGHRYRHQDRIRGFNAMREYSREVRVPRGQSMKSAEENWRHDVSKDEENNPNPRFMFKTVELTHFDLGEVWHRLMCTAAAAGGHGGDNIRRIREFQPTEPVNRWISELYHGYVFQQNPLLNRDCGIRLHHPDPYMRVFLGDLVRLKVYDKNVSPIHGVRGAGGMCAGLGVCLQQYSIHAYLYWV